MSIYKLFTLRAITSIHAGAGDSLDIVDLPIMRESHSDYPVIFGSALKGALRVNAKQQNQTKENEDIIYGSSSDDNKASADRASAISVGDARLLAMPIRSLTTHYRLVTCPYLLQRLKEQLAQMGKDTLPSLLDKIDDNQILIKQNDEHIYLEEYRYEAKQDNELEKWRKKLITIFSNLPKEALETLSIVSDSQFRHLCKVATAITPHIKIEENKIAKGGALWYEESLAPETLLYSLIIANDGRPKSENKEDEVMKEIDVMEKVEAQFPKSKPYLQVGGNETVGMGWCQTGFYSPQENSQDQSQNE